MRTRGSDYAFCRLEGSPVLTLLLGMGSVQLIIIIKSLVRVFASICVFMYIQVGVCSLGNIYLVF